MIESKAINQECNSCKGCCNLYCDKIMDMPIYYCKSSQVENETQIKITDEQIIIKLAYKIVPFDLTKPVWCPLTQT
jgi:hypothetical protein